MKGRSSEVPSRSRAYLILATLAATSMMLGFQALSAVQPELQRQLGIQDSQIGWFTAVYMFPGVLLAIPLGMAADALGRRVMFSSMMTLFGLAGAAQVLTDHYTLILVLRFFQGIGFATIMPLTITLIGDVYRGLEQLRAQSIKEVGMTAGEFIAPLLGAALAAISWRAPLLAQAAVLPLALVGLFLLRDSASPAKSDRYGINLRRAIRQPSMGSLFTLGFGRFFFKFAIIVYLPILLVNEGSATIGQAALVLSVISAAGAAGTLQTKRLIRRLSASTIVCLSLGIIGVGLGVLGASPNWIVAIVGAVLVGCGDGSMSVLQNSLLTQTVTSDVRAGVVGFSGATRNLGKFLAPLVMSGLVALMSIRAAFTAMALTAISMIPLGLGVRRLNQLLERPTPSVMAVKAASLSAADVNDIQDGLTVRDRFERQIVVPAHSGEVWPTLTDVDTVASWVSIIGSATEVIPLKSYSAVLQDRIGPFRLRADLDIQLEEVIENRCIKARARGEDRQVGSRISVDAEIELEERDEGSAIRIMGDYEVTGRVASLGAASIRKKADRLLNEFFGNVERVFSLKR